MDGAVHLRRNWLKSEILINTDTEELVKSILDLCGGVKCEY